MQLARDMSSTTMQTLAPLYIVLNIQTRLLKILIRETCLVTIRFRRVPIMFLFLSKDNLAADPRLFLYIGPRYLSRLSFEQIEI